MPKFIRVELDNGIQFINVDDIRNIRPKGTCDGFELRYAYPGSPMSSTIYVSKEELSKTYDLNQIA